MSVPSWPSMVDRTDTGDRLTVRARVYLAIITARHATLGAVCLLKPEHFTSGSYDGLKDALPFVSADQSMQAWGVIMLVVAIANLIPTFTGRETYARAGLLLNIVVTGCWVGGFVSAMLSGSSAGPSGLIVWSSIVLKDLTMLRDPLKNPFESVVRQVLAARDGR